MNRPGKIARLPHPLRTSINHRLDRNQPGRQIVNWLNSIPAVKKILRELFHNKPITEQNLSEWRNGGYLEWQIRRDFLADTRESLHDAAELEQLFPLMADHAARILNAVRKWNGDLDDPSLANLKHLSGLLRVIATLRRGDHSAARLKIQQSNHDRANAPDEDTESPGERVLLEGLRRLAYGIPRDTDPDDKSPPSSIPSIPSDSSDLSDPSPTKSDLIAPNQTISSDPTTPTPSEPAPPSAPRPFSIIHSSIIPAVASGPHVRRGIQPPPPPQPRPHARMARENPPPHPALAHHPVRSSHPAPVKIHHAVPLRILTGIGA
ncbi:MAG TPA: hypothetical protein VG796_27970 [Verrucomicrobiales bacterium]|nr:hypothetical protein [Verrucomicrobiales bacterium]